jgi:colanic acid/amylovoran biosynthesis glycosyltransferase
MKIAFIVNGFPMLSETFILNQITGMIDRGHEVDIYAYSHPNSSKMHPDVRKYKLLERTHYGVPMPRNLFLRFLRAVWLVPIISWKQPLVVLRSLNIYKYGRQAASLRLLYQVLSNFSSEPYDIIHCHYGTNGLLGLKLREIGALKGKVITTFHGYDMSLLIKQRGNNIYDHLFAKGDLFLPISKHWRTRLIELGCDEKKIIVHHMGVALRTLPFRHRTLDNNGSVGLVTVARLVEKKAVEYGIRAVSKLSKLNKNIDYSIIGDGPLRKRLELLISDLRLTDTVKLLGWKDHREVVNVLNSCHLLLSPSITSANGDQEGIPVAMMEAMAMGIPVISTQHSGIPELLQDGKSGFLVPERDVDVLAERLTYLIMHPEIWPKMGRAGRAYVEANYNIDKLNDRLVEIYHKVLNDG